MRALAFSCLWLCLIAASGPVGCSAGPLIVMDGSFVDWSGVRPVVQDAQACPGDADNPAGGRGAFVDFGSVHVAHDDLFVHLLIELGNEVNSQGLDGTAMLLLDCDGDPRTGETQHDLPGVDVVVELTPPDPNRPDRPGRGVGLRSTTYHPDPSDESQRQLIPYDIGFAFAPTYAASEVEFRMERGVNLPDTPALFAGSEFSGKLAFADLDGNVTDETDSFTYELSGGARRQAVPPQPIDPLAKADGVLRIVGWNAQRNAMFLHREQCVRTLAALKPDIVLIQELVDGTTASQLEGFCNTHLPQHGDSPWHAIFGQGTAAGDLHCAIVSRYPLRDVEPLRLITLLDEPDRTIRAVGVIVQIGETNLLATSVHLKCCGRKGGREDATRMAEVRAINRAIRDVMKIERIDAVVVAGDFNLVGARGPLDAMAASIDLDATDLAIPLPLQLDGMTNATWEDPAQPFTPGKLDYLLYSDSTLRMQRAFVYDSRDLAPRWREHHGVMPEDTATASDHLPLVVDVRRIDRGP